MKLSQIYLFLCFFLAASFHLSASSYIYFSNKTKNNIRVKIRRNKQKKLSKKYYKVKKRVVKKGKKKRILELNRNVGIKAGKEFEFIIGFEIERKGKNKQIKDIWFKLRLEGKTTGSRMWSMIKARRGCGKNRKKVDTGFDDSLGHHAKGTLFDGEIYVLSSDRYLVARDSYDNIDLTLHNY